MWRKRLAGLAILGILSIGPALAASGLVEPRMTIPPGGAAGPRVALTFDACDGRTDLRIVNMLVANRIPATIFASGRWIRSNPAALGLMLRHADLFDIENHGARHVPAIDRPMSVYGLAAAGSPQAVRAEVEGGADAVAKATGRRPTWFRGAAAEYTPSSLALIRSLGFKVGGFSMAADGGALLGAKLTASHIAAAHDGEVILSHINHPERSAGDGVVTGILALKARGVRFVKLDGSAVPAAGIAFNGLAGSKAR